MSVPTHVMPRGALRALANGGGGPEAIRRLRDAELSRTRLLVHHLVERTAAVGHPHAAMVRRAFTILLDVERAAASTVAGLLAYPTIGAWTVRTARALHGARPIAANPGFLAAVAAAAAALAGLPAVLDVPANPDGDRHIALPTVGWFDAGGAALLRVRTGGPGDAVVVPAAGRPRWHPVVQLDAGHGGLRLAADLDTAAWHHAFGAAYCDERGILAGPPDAALWQDRIAAAWALLSEHHRATAHELAEALRVLVPLAPPPHGTASSTLAEAFGAVALSTPTGPRTTALALAHELQHAKFTVLDRLHPLLAEETSAPDHYAPWRSDPRPLGALLDGAYAFLAVAGFWRTQRRVEADVAAREEADVNFQRWVTAAHDVTRMLLGRPALTGTGRFVAARMLARLERWHWEPVPDRAAATARDQATAHLDRFRRAHPHAVDSWCRSMPGLPRLP